MKSPVNNNNSKKEYRKDFRGSRKRGNFRRDREKKEPQKPLRIYTCELCSKDIQDINSAIALPENGSPVHFDCVISRLAERERLEEGERIIYLGGGSFGIVSGSAGSQKNSNFTIRKRIEFEDREKIAEWRKGLVRVKVQE